MAGDGGIAASWRGPAPGPHHRTMAPSPECVTRPEQHRQHRFLVGSSIFRLIHLTVVTTQCLREKCFWCDQIPRYKNPGSRPDYFWHQTAKIDFIEKAGLHLWPVVTRIRPIASLPGPMFKSKSWNNGKSGALWCVADFPKMSSSTTRWCSRQTMTNIIESCL